MKKGGWKNIDTLSKTQIILFFVRNQMKKNKNFIKYSSHKIYKHS